MSTPIILSVKLCINSRLHRPDRAAGYIRANRRYWIAGRARVFKGVLRYLVFRLPQAVLVCWKALGMGAFGMHNMLSAASFIRR